jgi:hypothetical protein
MRLTLTAAPTGKGISLCMDSMTTGEGGGLMGVTSFSSSPEQPVKNINVASKNRIWFFMILIFFSLSAKESEFVKNIINVPEK